jgi:hypothetical protein
MFASLICSTELKTCAADRLIDCGGQKETLAISNDRLPRLAAVAKRDHIGPS